MSRSMHGLHKAVGGILKRRREALADLDGKTCTLSACNTPAAGLLENWAGQLFPICSRHIHGARERGYSVYLPEKAEQQE